MKVISGLYKGRNIEGYDIDGTRPTMDRVKESLFATIQNYVKESTILDLFAGSGSLGIEALSEGASYAYLVDKNIKCTKLIEKNLKNFGIENCKVLFLDYLAALATFAKEKKSFDIIFLDPPYKTDYIEKALEKISELNLLAPGGIIVCESDDLNKIIYDKAYTKYKEKKYGDKWVVILKQI